MLTTELHECGLSVFYDGHEFSIIPYAEDLIGVYCERRGEWDDYMPGHTFRDFADVCSAIFYGTIAVDRTESGHVHFDRFGNIVELVPLTYYDVPVKPEPIDVPAWFELDDEFDNIII